MAVDASAVASVLGIETQYQDLREGNAKFLPQFLALFVQGETGASFSLERWTATSAAATGARYGYKSPAYLAAKELLPKDGDGVGTIPVCIFPIADDASGVASVGTITPSGTATKAFTVRVIVSGIKGGKFQIPAGAIDVTNVCRWLRESIEATLGMPGTASNTYGTVTASDVQTDGSADGTVTSLSLTGTPLPGAYTLTCITAVSDGGVFKLVDPNGVLISDTITMTPGSGGTTVIDVGGIQFTITDGANDFEVDDYFTITVPATNTKFTSGWKGSSANAIYLEVEVSESVGVTFAIVQPTGGAVNPAVDDALALVGTTWATMGLNQMEVADTDALDAFKTFGEARWGELVHKPLVVFTGNTDVAYEDASAISSTRTDDRVNSELVAPGSTNLPFVVAARQLARIAKVANNNPPVDYVGQKATGLTPGDDSEQWDFLVRDLANKAGCSTVEVEDGVVQISDVVTFYRPEGEEPPGYADVVDIVKVQNCIYNLSLEFGAQEWAAAPLVPDDEPVRNVAARKPKHAKAAIFAIIDGLADEAIVVNRKAIKDSVTAVISSTNPKRLDITVTWQISGNTKQKNILSKFGFYFGTKPLAA